MPMTEQRKARLAFIGAGAFATHSIYPQVHLVPQIDLVAVCDIDRAKAERNARNFGARAVYTDLEEMLDREKPDGVFCIDRHWCSYGVGCFSRIREAQRA